MQVTHDLCIEEDVHKEANEIFLNQVQKEGDTSHDKAMVEDLPKEVLNKTERPKSSKNSAF